MCCPCSFTPLFGLHLAHVVCLSPSESSNHEIGSAILMFIPAKSHPLLSCLLFCSWIQHTFWPLLQNLYPSLPLISCLSPSLSWLYHSQKSVFSSDNCALSPLLAHMLGSASQNTQEIFPHLISFNPFLKTHFFSRTSLAAH